jgi:hypothetical protein
MLGVLTSFDEGRPLVDEYDGRQVVGIDLHRRRSVTPHPLTKVGGAYRFTDEHLYEIIRIFEQRPVQTEAPDAGTAPRRSTTSSQPMAPVVQLRARHPRRARKAG